MGLLLLTACAGAVAAEVGSVVIATPEGPLTCYFHDTEHLPSTRIWVFGTHTEQIPTDEAAFVGQGWGGPPQSFFEGVSQAGLAASLYSTYQFELTMDGLRVVPDTMVIWPWVTEQGLATWASRRHYEFAPGALAPGIHLLTGTWLLVDLPCIWYPESCTSAELRDNPHYVFHPEQGTYDFASAAKTLTLTVVNP